MITPPPPPTTTTTTRSKILAKGAKYIGDVKKVNLTFFGPNFFAKLSLNFNFG